MKDINDSDVMKVKTFEDLLHVIKREGRWQYQILLLFLVQELLTICSSVNYIYMVGIPNYYCTVPELENANWTMEEIQAATGTNSTNQCEIIDRNYSAIALGWDETTLTTKVKVPCEHWKFTANGYYGNTAVSEWSLICSNSPLRPTIQGVYMFGVLFGSLTGGILADTYGRRTANLIMIILFAFGGIGCSLVPEYTVFLIFRFITGFGAMGTYVSVYSLVLECLVAEIRAKWTCYVSLVNSGLSLIFTGAAYGMRNFRYFNLMYAIPSIVVATVSCWYLPESPRWLITHNRLDEATHIIQNAAQKNKVQFKDDAVVKKMVDDVYNNIQKEENTEMVSISMTLGNKVWYWMKKFRNAGRNSAFRTRVFCMGITWFAVSVSSYGCGYLSVQLDFGPYIPDIISTGIGIIAFFLMKPAVDYFGRKPVMYVGFFVNAAIILGAAFAPQFPLWLPFTLMEITGFFNCILFNDVYLMAAELFPTEVRSSAICYGSICATIGAIIAPYVVDLLITPYNFIPGLIFGGISAVAGFVTLFLPETKEKCLPNTVFEIKEESATETSTV